MIIYVVHMEIVFQNGVFLQSLLVPRKPSQDDIKKGRMGQPRRRTYSQEVDTDRLVVEAVQAARTGNLQKMKTYVVGPFDFCLPSK